jgi:glutamate-ammonia-ligase adenylyltransferase
VLFRSRELGGGPGELALKYAPGGLVDVEFAAQLLQMTHGGAPASLRTPTTRRAVAALRDAGLLAAGTADALLAGERVLRRAQLAARFVTERGVLVAGGGAVATVARKLGYRDRDARDAGALLLADLDATRRRVRAAFDAVIRVASAT